MSGRVTSAWASARAHGMYLDRFSADCDGALTKVFACTVPVEFRFVFYVYQSLLFSIIILSRLSNKHEAGRN